MVHPRVYRGRFLRVSAVLSMLAVTVLVLTLLSACGGQRRETPHANPDRGPAGLTDAAWGALLYRDRGCSGCHSLDSRGATSRSLNALVVAHVPATGDDDKPAPDAVVVHDQTWAEALLQKPRHGSGDAMVQLGLSTPEARALAAFLQTCH